MPDEAPRPICPRCGKVGPLRAKGVCAACYEKDRRAGMKANASSKPAGGRAKAPGGHGDTAKHREIEHQVGTLIQVVNMGLVAQAFPEDALNDGEVGLLARHAANEILGSKRLQQYLELVSTAGGVHGGMVAAVVCIALPRAVRHGLVPLEVAKPLFAVASMIAMAGTELPEVVDAETAPAREPEPEPVGAAA